MHIIKAIKVIVAFAISNFLFSSFLQAQDLSAGELDSLFNVFVNLRVTEVSLESGTQPQIKDEDHKCGLEIVNAIAFNLDMFDNDKQLLLKPLLQRPEIDEGQVFDVVIKAIPNKRITLITEGIEYFNDYEIYLLEERLGQLYNLKEKSDISITPLHQYNSYKLLIGDSDFINDIKEGLVPTEYVLYQNYPNPFNPRTIVRFSLPKKSSV